MWILFKGLIILSSVFTLRYVTIDPFWKPKEGVFLLFGFIFLASCWLSKSSSRYIFRNKWLSAFFIYIALLFGVNFLYPFVTNIKTLSISNNGVVSSIPLILPAIWYTVLPTINVFLALLLVHHLVEYTDSLDRWVGVVKVVCWVGFGLAVYSILQFLGCDQIYPKVTHNTAVEKVTHTFKIFTFMGNKMLSANIIAIITPLFLIFKIRKYYLAMAVCLLALCFLKSAFNIGVAILGICLVLFLQGNWRLSLAVMVSSLSLLVIFGNKTNFFSMLHNKNLNGRIDMWRETILKSKNSILTGQGLGSMFRDFSPVKASWQRFHSSHNMLIDILYETGLFGLVIMIGYIFNLIKRVCIVFLERNQSMLLIGLCGGFVSYLMMSMSSFPHRIAPLALVGIIYVAGIEVHLSKRRNII